MRREARVVLALGRRALSVQFRRAQLLMPTFVLPLMLLAVITSGTAAARGLRGFPDVESYLAFIVPGTIVQGALLAGLTSGTAMAADIEFGFFDRLLAAPVNRVSLVLGRQGGTLGLALGAELPGGVPGLVALYVASVGFCTVAGLWGIFMALTFRTQQAGPLMQQGVFLAAFLSTAYTPQALLRGWLAEAAHLNPATHVLELARQATVSGIEPSLSHTLPGLLALAGMLAFFGTLVMVGLRRMGR